MLAAFNSIRTSRKLVHRDDRLLLYFAGHSLNVKVNGDGMGHVAPVDARPDDVETYISIRDFVRLSSSINAKHIFTIINACLSGVVPREFSTSPDTELEAMLTHKAHQLLGWYPRWTVDKTLAATAEWYKAVLGGAKAEAVTRGQICDYFPELS